jgi:predicted nucleic acid-binding protein
MPAADSLVFIDTNVLIYLLSADPKKADLAEAVVRTGSLVSVQVLNEMTNIMRRKLAMSWEEINEVITIIRSICTIEPLTIDTHDRGRLIAKRYGFSVYDSMIVASALLAGCKTLYSEDLQHGQLLEQQLRVSNPFSG